MTREELVAFAVGTLVILSVLAAGWIIHDVVAWFIRRRRQH